MTEERRYSSSRLWNAEYNGFNRTTVTLLGAVSGGQSGTTFKYDYDAAGNITRKYICAYNTGVLPRDSSSIDYTYGDSAWGDLLTKYDGTDIEYDEIGNPISIGSNYSLTWSQGRRLVSFEEMDGVSLQFTYNADGIRTSKTLDGVTHYYLLNGSTILSEEWTDGGDQHLMVYVYDANGSPIGYRYRNSYYSEGEFDSFLYKKNLQGDITGIYGTDGTCYATYVYDAWGYRLSNTAKSIDEVEKIR